MAQRRLKLAQCLTGFAARVTPAGRQQDRAFPSSAWQHCSAVYALLLRRLPDAAGAISTVVLVVNFAQALLSLRERASCLAKLDQPWPVHDAVS